MSIKKIKTTLFLGICIVAISILSCKQGYENGTGEAQAKESPVSTPAPIYSFTMENIDGIPVPLNQFQGKVMLVVNTASFCGNTPQYEGLQQLYQHYREQGFEILAFPANNFGQQEPGTNEEIKTFCYTKYALEFPLFSKISVKGLDTHPLYRYLTEDSPFPGEIEWNFQKFLIDRKGKVVARYQPRTKPLSDEIIKGIEQALAQS